VSRDIISELKSIVGDKDVLTGSDASARTTVWDTQQPCLAQAVLRPSSTEQVSAIMKTCFEHAQSVVPYGGLTNLVQGCATTPDDIALSFEKMNAIEDIDTTAHTMTVQAGVTMLAAQEAADAEDLFFPVDIGARGTCMLGGNVSSNAGGTKVIRYGMMRDSVLGLEAVLALYQEQFRVRPETPFYRHRGCAGSRYQDRLSSRRQAADTQCRAGRLR
jgi:FAD/FMN-containing dehydrogenase